MASQSTCPECDQPAKRINGVEGCYDTFSCRNCFWVFHKATEGMENPNGSIQTYETHLTQTVRAHYV